ncbi:putative membrane protein C6F6.13c [Hypsizygus marmoreus]|uniref:Membrane protein C6F6.13c n=1 Tax=Hypsizygus marmoreus TaxID=39966 RepID=A0A369JHZ8_HYPMA|nr:putative membrane protein C6F6.13c [Hypsizygus marmoreus]
MTADLTKLVPPKTLTHEDKATVFDHFFCRLASYRNTLELYSDAEYTMSSLPEERRARRRDQHQEEVARWAHSLVEKAWIVCKESEGDCPKLDKYADTSIAGLPSLPPTEDLTKVLNTILFLDIVASKQYSARTRTFLSTFGSLDEPTIVATLKNPERAIGEAEKQIEEAREVHAERGKVLRVMGMGFGAVAGGVLIGVTGGLAAPLVGAGVTTLLGWLGVGGTIVGLLASGLAGSSVVCGALFGVYGAQSTANMVERHTREVRDLAVVPVRDIKENETLGVRLCVSGWLSSREDVTAPWTVCGGDDTFALQWEVEVLEQLSNALVTLVKSHAIKYVKMQVIRRTILASLMSSLAPIAWLKIGQIIDNPWMNARARAVKAGAVLGDLLANHVFGNRPLTLTGYSLGSLVIFEALKYLASLPPANTTHLVQDVFLFGTPTPADMSTWASVRRLVSGRLVNGYSSNDYILAVLSRASDANWNVAGLQPIDVMGVENILCEGVDGHTMWRGMIGKCLRDCQAPGIISDEVELQLKIVPAEILAMEESEKSSREQSPGETGGEQK